MFYKRKTNMKTIIYSFPLKSKEHQHMSVEVEDEDWHGSFIEFFTGKDFDVQKINTVPEFVKRKFTEFVFSNDFERDYS
jgi:hypothetical protein